MKYFEYKTILIDRRGMFTTKTLDPSRIDKALNQLGYHGWELVSIVQATADCSGVNGLVCVLKRCSNTKYAQKHKELAIGRPYSR